LCLTSEKYNKIVKFLLLFQFHSNFCSVLQAQHDDIFDAELSENEDAAPNDTQTQPGDNVVDGGGAGEPVNNSEEKTMTCHTTEGGDATMPAASTSDSQVGLCPNLS